MTREEIIEVCERIENLPIEVTRFMDPRTIYLLDELRKMLQREVKDNECN